MAKIEVGRFSSVMRKFLAMKGVEQVTPELSPEISATFTLESDRLDWKYLKGEKILGFGNSRTSIAAAGPTFRIRNPAASGTIVTIDWFEMNVTTAADVARITLIEVGADLLGGVLAPISRDTRNAISASNSAIIVSFATNVAPAGSQLWTQNLPVSGMPTHIPLQVVLTPGFAVDFGTVTATALTLFGAAQWSERGLSALEAA